MSATWNSRSVLIGVLFLAAALRAAACWAWAADLTRDPDAYLGLAERIAAGEGFVAPDGRPTAYRPPLYPFMLAAVISAGPVGIAVMQIALGTAAVGLVVAMGRRLGLKHFAFVAGAIVAVDPLLLRYTPQVMTEVTCAFLAILVVWLSMVVFERIASPSASIHRMSLLAVLQGAAFGLAVLSRPTFWVFGVLFVLAWIAGPLRQRLPRKRLGVLVAGSVVGLAIVVAPWVLRNREAVGAPIVTTTHGGYTLLLANNPVFWREVVLSPRQDAWGGESLDSWQKSIEAAMTADQVSPADEITRDGWMRDRALEHIGRQPMLFVRSVAYRIGRFWSVVPSQAGSTSMKWGVGVFYAITHALAFIGLLAVVWQFWKTRHVETGWILVTLLIAAFTAVHAIYWTDARMRAPCVPAVALFAALGSTVTWRTVKRGRLGG